MWYRENWTPAYKRRKLELSLAPYIKRNLKWIIDLNVRPDTIKDRGKLRTTWIKAMTSNAACGPGSERQKL